MNTGRVVNGLLLGLCLLLAFAPGKSNSLAEGTRSVFPSVPAEFLDTVHALEVGTAGHWSSTGTCVAISKNRALTAAHMWAGSKDKEDVEIRVWIQHSKHNTSFQAEGKLVKIDEGEDIAIISVDSDFKTWAAIDPESRINPGDPTIVIGNASGVNPLVASFGFFASKENRARDAGEFSAHWVSSNGIWFGNSGGPVFNANTGLVIGIAVASTRAPNICLFTPLAHKKGWFK
jgi:S1-C subfamily serine protease